jgi:pRiA4b ORF-3-like protein
MSSSPLTFIGRRACPTEDVGRIWGYQEFLDVIGDPQLDDDRDLSIRQILLMAKVSIGREDPAASAVSSSSPFRRVSQLCERHSSTV